MPDEVECLMRDGQASKQALVSSDFEQHKGPISRMQESALNYLELELWVRYQILMRLRPLELI